MRRKPRLTLAHRKRRLIFAETHAQMPESFWDSVIFSDETPLHIYHSIRGQRVWRRVGEELKEGYYEPTVKHGGGSLMVWGCLTSSGVGWSCALPEGIDSETYIEILEGEMLLTRDHYFPGRKDVVFQQDGAGVHTAKVVNGWFLQQKIPVLNWPAQSPDLNPLENLWADVKRRITLKHPNISNRDEAWEAFEEEWEKTPKEFCFKLAHSMPQRLQAVIKAKGGPTKY
jgi:hypothetical protein